MSFMQNIFVSSDFTFNILKILMEMNPEYNGMIQH